MVTECLPVGCSSCFREDAVYERDSVSGITSHNPFEKLPDLANTSVRKKSISPRNENLSSSDPNPSTNTFIKIPSGTSKNGKEHGSSTSPDSSFRRTYDDIVKKKGSPCDNCALTLPKQTDLSTSPVKLENNSPILRTRKPYQRVAASVLVDQSSPSNSDYSGAKLDLDVSCTREEHKSHCMNRSGKSSKSFNFSSTTSLHDHYLDYISTHESMVPKSFSIIRQSCLRTLSCELLPPSTNQPVSTNNSSFTGGEHFTSSAPSPSSSGGPIFFGDPVAGYTTAYTFRIPDPNVRGRHRVYALMALTSQCESAAIRTFTYLSFIFRETAQWILTLAELELEKSKHSKQANQESKLESSFLTGYRGPHDVSSKLILKNRGLAEIVGMPDFFIELHTRFVRYLAELRIILRT